MANKSFKAFVIAAFAALPVAQPTFAQAVTVDVEAISAEVSLTCSTTPADCAAAMTRALSQLKAAGLTEAQFNAAVGRVVAAVASVAATVPAAARAALGAAIRVALDPANGFTAAAAPAMLAAARNLAENFEAGNDVPANVVAQLGSSN